MNNHLKISYFRILALLLGFSVFFQGCSEEIEPTTQPVVEDPIIEGPEIKDPVKDPNDDIDFSKLFSQLQGKWIFGERERSNDRTNPNINKGLLRFGQATFNLSSRVMDDYQGFIEFLSDTTFIFNDPKVLQSSWKLKYGKFQIEIENKKLVLEGYGEIEIQELNNKTVKFALKESASNSNYSLKGVKREFLDDSEKTGLICKIWSLTDENDFGKEILDDLKNGGVEIYGENGQIVDRIYPDAVLFIITPSGTLMSAHPLENTIRGFDISNWRWNSEGNFLLLSYDHKDLENQDDELVGFKLKILTQNRLVLGDSYTDEDGNNYEEEWIFKF